MVCYPACTRTIWQGCILPCVLAFFFGIMPPLTGHAWGDPAEELTYLTEQYYPYNFENETGLCGISVDILRLMWTELGIAKKSIQLLPWARVYDLIQQEPGTVAFGMARTPEREGLFRWVGPIETVRFVLLAKKSRHIAIETMADIKGYAVGTLIDDITDVILKPVGKLARIEPVADMEFSLKMLEHDRIDLIAYEEQGFAGLAKANGHDPDEYETVYVLRETGIYYAFHIETPRELVSRFQRAFNAVRSRPEYREILKKYLPRP